MLPNIPLEFIAPRSLMNYLTDDTPLPSQHREDGRTSGLPRIPRESRDFWHQFLPVISSFRPSTLSLYLFIYLYLCRLYLSADKCSLADKSRLAAGSGGEGGEEAKIPRGNVDCVIQWHAYLRYARNAHLCTRTHVHAGTENDTSLA